MQHLLFDPSDPDIDMQYSIMDFDTKKWTEWGNLPRVLTAHEDDAFYSMISGNKTINSFIDSNPKFKLIYSAPAITEKHVIDNFPELLI